MKVWFFGLQPRERWIVVIGAVAAVIIITWVSILRPLRGEIATLHASVDTKQRLLVDVVRVEGEQPGNVVGNRLGVDQTLVVIVDNTARSHGLNPARTRANGPSGVDISIQSASFDALVAWLVLLDVTYGVDVETASFTSGREPGYVNGQLSLRRL